MNMRQLTSILVCIVLLCLTVTAQNDFTIGAHRADLTDVESYHQWVTAYNHKNTIVRSRNNHTHQLDEVFHWFSDQNSLVLERKGRIEYFYSDTLEISIGSNCDALECRRVGFSLAHLDAQQRVIEITGHTGWDNTAEVYDNHAAVKKELYTYNVQGLVDSITLWSTIPSDPGITVTTHYYNDNNLLDSIIQYQQPTLSKTPSQQLPDSTFIMIRN